jgi:hypothetical protein
MRYAAFTLLLCGALACNSDSSESKAGDGDKKGDEKGILVDLDGLKSRAPAAWKEEEPTSNLRYQQFRLPKVKDDKYDAELVIFRGIGGSVKDNVQRWKDDFRPPQGKKADDLSKVTEMKLGELNVTYVEVQGTYLFRTRPRDPNEKPQERPDYRLLGVIFSTEKNPYQIRLVGPAKTVEHYKQGFDDWLKAFK